MLDKVNAQSAVSTGDYNQVPKLIKERFPVRNNNFQTEPIDFERILLCDIGIDAETASINILCTDWDFSESGGLLNLDVDAKTRFELARHVFDRERKKPPYYKSMDADGINGAVAQEVEGFAQTEGLGQAKMPPLPYISPVDIYPSMFDYTFKGPTGIIVRSHIKSLRFHPDPFRFAYEKHMTYYRNAEVADDLTSCSLINAFVDSNEGTPHNQEHKVDFKMIHSQWGSNPASWKKAGNTKKFDWLMVPIIIDPPYDNTGGGGPGGGG